MKKPRFILVISTFLALLIPLMGSGKVLLANSQAVPEQTQAQVEPPAAADTSQAVPDQTSAVTSHSSSEATSAQAEAQVSSSTGLLQTQNQTTSTSDQNDAPSPIDSYSKRMDFLNKIKTELEMVKADYATINGHIQATQQKLGSIQATSLDLNQQVENMDRQIAQTMEMIQNTLLHITEKENALQHLQDEIEQGKTDIEKEKKLLLEYITTLYQQDQAILNSNEAEATINMAKLLLSDQPAGEILQQMHYVGILENVGKQIFQKLDSLMRAQEQKQADLENERNGLTLLYRQLDEDRSDLEAQREGKNQLLEQTRGEESIYQKLLDESKTEQEQTALDIDSLRGNLKFINAKITELGDKFNPDDYKGLLDEKTTAIYNYLQANDQNKEFAPRWPVSPSRGISAYFHDPGYKAAMKVEHEAIDIRVPQATPVHAPADGIVFKARDNGFGYSYIILAHAGGFMTVYGHVSEIRVFEGQNVRVGQVIGLSGATPGTKGAGLLTTGPHLHFEILDGGKHVDPLDYLPLSYLPLKSLPEKYLSRITGEAQQMQQNETPGSQFQTGDELIRSVEADGNSETTVDADYFSKWPGWDAPSTLMPK